MGINSILNRNKLDQISYDDPINLFFVDKTATGITCCRFFLPIFSKVQRNNGFIRIVTIELNFLPALLYKALNITLNPQTSEMTEILIALLDSFDFEGITEEEGGIRAYIPAGNFNNDMVDELKGRFEAYSCSITIAIEDVPEQNWNSIWESNFEPVVIGDRCVIRAPF